VRKVLLSKNDVNGNLPVRAEPRGRRHSFS
jgi:hypothetical protein